MMPAVTGKHQQAAPSCLITGVTVQDGPIGEKKSFVSEEGKHIKSSLGDDEKEVTPVTPINKDATVAVVTVSEGLPDGYRNSQKSDVSEPIERLPEPRNKDEPTPTTKSRLWDAIGSKLKKMGRKDQDRRGLAVSDLSPGELELITAAGWQQETTETGITILWAPEKAAKALAVTA